MLGNLNLALFPVACHVQLPDDVEQINAPLEHVYCEFWHHMCNARCLVHVLYKNPGCSQIIDLGTYRALQTITCKETRQGRGLNKETRSE